MENPGDPGNQCSIKRCWNTDYHDCHDKPGFV